MRRLAALVLVACGHTGGGVVQVDGHTDDARPVDGPPACARTPTVSRTQFIDASVDYLRAAFSTTQGFDAGTVAYGEGWVSVSDAPCPRADWTTLAYVSPIDPLLVPIELRADHDRVAALWALNGRKFIAYLPSVPGDVAPWWQAYMPDNSNAVAKATADHGQIVQLVAQLTTDIPSVTTTWLDAIGFVTLESPIGTFASDAPPTGKVPEIEAATQRVRASGLFDSVSWSGFQVRIPSASWPATAVTDDTLAPECSRTETAALRDHDQLSTVPSFAPPLGPGPVDNPAACTM